MRSAALAAAHEQLQLSGDEAVRAAGLLVAGQTESLARLAAGSADPVTYAIGLQACMDKSTTQAPACALLGRAQWARLDPDNAWPWLELAADARERGDAEGETRAMSRAAQASHLDEISGRLPGLIDKGMGELPGLPRTLVLQASWQRQSVWHSLAALQADRYCSTGVLMQGGGRPQCDALARTLVTNSTRIEHLAAGAALGARLGWPAPRLEGLRQEADALAEAAQMQTLATDASCESAVRVHGWLLAVGASGEVNAARAWLESSGASVGAWGTQRRKNVELAAATAAEAAIAGAKLSP